jgi:pyruvate dehydrogenase E2 component (dihydrolipoamide acetyltransferase)
MAKRWQKLDKYSPWRKISMGLWTPPDDPTIYGKETVDVSNLIPYLDEVSEASGVRVTVPAYTAALMADILRTHPDLNVMPIGNHICQRETIDVFCQVAVSSGSAGSADLSGIKLREADDLDLVEVATFMRSKAGDVRDGKNVEMEESKRFVHLIPNALMGAMLNLLDFLTYSIPWDLDAVGVRSDPFGSCMVTSVGQFDIKQGFAPLVPGSHCPLVALPGKVWRKPFATEDDEVEVRDALTMSCTFDHRCYDGLQIGYIVREMRSRLMYPRKHFPEPSHWADASEESGDADETVAAE